LVAAPASEEKEMPTARRPSLALFLAVAFLAAHAGAGQDQYEIVQEFTPAECPKSRCTLTEASYPFGRWTVRILHAEVKPGISMDNLPDDQRWICKAWLELRDKRGRLKVRLFGSEIEPVGGPGGLFVPPQQPIPGLFVVAKDGDYAGEVFAIHADGKVDRFVGSIHIFDPEHGLLFLGSDDPEATAEVAVLDRSGLQIVFKDPDSYASTWYRLSKEIFFLGAEVDGRPADQVGFFFDFAHRKFDRRPLKPGDLAKATAIPPAFDLRPLRNCHSPTVNEG